jgi:hydrogenase nickel incorporation protein HypA/HybF
MHELSIALSIVERVEEELRRQGDARVCSVHVRIGPLSGVVPDALSFSYEVACQGTVLEGSQLHIRKVPVRVWCDNCAVETDAVSIHYLHCPQCRGSGRVVSGDEMELETIELKDPEHATATVS